MRSNPLREQAIDLRSRGYSYGEILKELKLGSKGTLSYWLSKVKLSPAAKKRLRDNVQLATKRGLKRFNSERTNRIVAENELEYRLGRNALRGHKQGILAVLGAALYWGEGTKSELPGRNPALVFTNSDPRMIKVFMRFVRDILCVKESRIRAGIHLYPDTSKSAARKFWSVTTKLPPERFYVSTFVSRASKGRRRKHALPYGTLAIRVNDRKTFFRVKGMVHALTELR